MATKTRVNFILNVKLDRILDLKKNKDAKGLNILRKVPVALAVRYQIKL